MGDFGLYMALRGQDDWATKRQDARMEMAIAEKREQRAKEDLANSMQLEEGMQSAFDALANLDVLPQDQERMRAIEKESRKKIVNRIAEYNGDLKRYMASGGISDMHEYKNSVLKSNEYKNALQNKTNLQLYLQDRSKGMRAKSIIVDLPGRDELGNEIVKPTKMTVEENIKLFNEGKIDKINYAGGEQKVNIGIEDFSKLFKNPLNPYSQDNFVTVSDIYKKAISKGASDEYAREIAANYKKMYEEGGRAWRWGAKDPMELQMKQQQMEMQRMRLDAMKGKAAGGGKSGGGSSNMITNYWGKINYLKPGQGLPTTHDEKQDLIQALGIQPIPENQSNGVPGWRFQGDIIGPDMKTVIPNNKGKIINFPMNNSIVMLPDGKAALRVRMVFDNDSSVEEGGLADPDSWWIDKPNDAFGDAVKINSGDGIGGYFGRGSYEADVFISVDPLLRDPYTREALNNKMNIRTNHTNPYTDYDQNAQFNDAMQNAQMWDQFNEQDYNTEE